MKTLSIEEGYAAQAQSEQKWIAEGRLASGWKVGLTSLAAQKRMGSDSPCYGRLFLDMAVPNESTVDWGRFGNPLIEAEIAFRLGQDLHPGDRMSDAIEQTIPAIEIVDSPYSKGPSGPGELVANNVSAAGFVLGNPVTFEPHFDLQDCRAEVERNGKIERTGLGSDCLGSPLLSLDWLAESLESYDRRLRAGDLILTGSLIAPLAAGPGDEIRIEFEGLGSVSVSFAEEQ